MFLDGLPVIWTLWLPERLEMQTPTLAPFHLDRTYRQIYHVNRFSSVGATARRSRHCCPGHPVSLGEILTKVRLREATRQG